jgi:6-phosphogluconolactonase
VANYGSGSVAVLRISDDGRLESASAFIQHEGSSINPSRQKAPHAHSINVDSGNRFAFAADLGLDKIMIYRFDPAQGTLAPHQPESVSLKPGAGPRHFAFHPTGRYAYVINELDSTVTAFTCQPERGALNAIQTISTLPQDFRGENSTAEVQVHPTGKFLYGSNRGHDSIAVFAIDPSSGRLTYVENEPTQGQTPRNFGIDPTGTFLLAANQDSDTVVVFRIDVTSGQLQPAGQTVKVPSPVCVKMML